MAPNDLMAAAPAAEPETEETGRVRAHTVSRKALAREARHERLYGDINEQAELDELKKELEGRRPKKRSDCAPGSALRPKGGACLFFACKHNLVLDINPETGSVKHNFPDKEFWQLKDTCALDVADRGGATLEEVGQLMNFSRERTRQIETDVVVKLRAADPRLAKEFERNAELKHTKPLPKTTSDMTRHEAERAALLARFGAHIPPSAGPATAELVRKARIHAEVASEFAAASEAGLHPFARDPIYPSSASSFSRSGGLSGGGSTPSATAPTAPKPTQGDKPGGGR